MTGSAPSGDAPGPDQPGADAIEAGRLLFAQECRFVRGALSPKDMPPMGLPEVAFCGRSNVGKSSLLNALTGRTNLARTSNTPGRTREVNFFDLGGRLSLVDLPGYGYAKAPKTQVAGWTRAIDAYLQGRASLQRVCLLVDARHGIKPSDAGVMDLLDQVAVSYQLVLTKADKLKSAEAAKIEADTLAALRKHPAAHPELLATSARSGAGIAELRATLASLALAPEAAVRNAADTPST